MPDVTMKRPASQRRAPGVSYQRPHPMTLPSDADIGIARRVGERRRAKQGLMPPVMLHGRWYEPAGTEA